MFRHIVTDQNAMGPSINYVVLVEWEGVSPKDDLLNRPYLIKKTTSGRGSKIANVANDIVYGRPHVSLKQTEFKVGFEMYVS